MTQGGDGTRLHRIWKGMKGRCQTPSSSSFARYGGRGIRVCAEWQTFVGFLDWALANGYRYDLDLDRIDSDGDYEASNCRWTLPKINAGRSSLDRDGRYLQQLVGTLTSEVVEAAEAGKLWDGEGLHLFVSPTGAKSWRLKYRLHGREGLLTLGRYPTVSLEQARELAKIARAKVARGIRPRSTAKR